MKHWTAERRLPGEEAEKLMQDYNVMAALMKIKALQTACQRAGIPVPLHEVLRMQTSVDESRLEKAGVKPLVGAGGSADGGRDGGAKKKKEPEGETAAVKETATTTTTSTATANVAAPTRRKKSAASIATTGMSGMSPPLPPQRQQVQVPTTLFGWIHLFSPLIALVFGLLYVIHLIFFKQK